MTMSFIPKVLILSGVILIISGLIWHFFYEERIPLGRLPGDFKYETKNFKIYIPLMSSLILSALVSLLAYFLRK